MLVSGEGGLGVGIGFTVWVPHSFTDMGEALDFLEKNKEKTDGYIHPGEDEKTVVIFTRKENTNGS